MRAPHFWSAGLDPRSREAAPLTRALLTPLAGLYLLALKRRLGKTRPAIAPVPVICVGNLTVGGAGKTPVTEAIRGWLQAAGLRAASLSRGHGGRLHGPLKVDPRSHSWQDTGDEPLMLAATGEAWIGRRRAEAATDMARAGVEVIVMDDGHQNPSLRKDLSLIVIDAAAPFGNGHVLPKGPLREPVSAGLARAQGVILLGDGPVPGDVTGSGLPVLRASLAPEQPPPPGRLVAFAGIGRPRKFFDGLARAGGEVVDEVPFSDHHPYTESDIRYLRQLARDAQGQLITTAKDHVRLPAQAAAEIASWPVRAVFEDEAALARLLAPVVTGTRAGLRT